MVSRRDREREDVVLTHQSLVEMLHYDRMTGVFIWLKPNSRRMRIGERAGSLSHGYVSISIGWKNHLAHRLAWFWMTGAWPMGQVDHRDTVRSNNRWRNLRDATRSQNHANIRVGASNSSGIKGVSHSGSKWRARVKVHGKEHYLGAFQTKRAARTAYIAGAKRLFGEFARAA